MNFRIRKRLERSSGASRRLRVVWVANIAFPYRIALYAKMQEYNDSIVLLLGKSEPNRHWSNENLPAFVSFLPAVQVPAGKYLFYMFVPVLSMHRFRQTRADVIILPSWHYPCAWRLLLWAKMSKTPAIAWYESTKMSRGMNNRMANNARAQFHRAASGVLSTGSQTTEALLEMGIPRNRIVTGYNAVDGKLFARVAKEVRSTRRELGSSHTYMFVGQLIGRKRPDVVLRAFAACRLRDDQLIVVGDGPLRTQIEHLAVELEIELSVQFVGNVDPMQMPHVYAQADTLVLPSTEEVWGLVVNEALSTGLHVVVSESCGVAADVGTHKGVFVTCPDVSSVTQAMMTSRASWDGPITEPEILNMTIEHLAEATAAAIDRFASAERPGKYKRSGSEGKQ